MKTVTAAAAILLLAGGAMAQTAPPSGSAPAAAAAAPFDLDTPIETIAADPAGRAVLDKDLPTLRPHPAYEDFKGMSLTQVAPMSQGALTDELLAKTGADLKALGPRPAAK